MDILFWYYTKLDKRYFSKCFAICTRKPYQWSCVLCYINIYWFIFYCEWIVLPVYDFLTSCSGHLEDTGSLELWRPSKYWHISLNIIGKVFLTSINSTVVDKSFLEFLFLLETQWSLATNNCFPWSDRFTSCMTKYLPNIVAWITTDIIHIKMILYEKHPASSALKSSYHTSVFPEEHHTMRCSNRASAYSSQFFI